jgi:hypothetical protein
VSYIVKCPFFGFRTVSEIFLLLFIKEAYDRPLLVCKLALLNNLAKDICIFR